MIKKIELQNVFGIRQLQTLNFEIKHLKKGQLFNDNGVVKTANDEKILLTPTFIANNGCGKTSILKALEFSDRINSIEDIIKIFFIDIESQIESIADFIYHHSWRWSFTKKLKNSTTLKSWFGSKKNMLIMIDLVNNWIKENIHHSNFNDSTIKYFDYLKEELLAKKMKLEEIMITLRKIIWIHFDNIIQDSDLINFNNPLSSNFLVSQNKTQEDQENTEIKINIYYANSQNNKIINIGKNIVFNNEKMPMSEIKKKIKDKIYLKIKNLDFFKISKEASGKAAKKFTNHQKFQMIDDLIIKNKINQWTPFKKNNVLNLPKHDSVLNKIINSTSLEFVEKMLKIIDNSISHIQMQESRLQTVVDKNGYNKNFSILSYGTQKVLIVIHELIKLAKNKEQVLLIDEIENGLNLSLIKLLLKIISNQSINKNNNQIIITTHNPALFDNHIVSYINAFICFENQFINISEADELINRTEDQHSHFKNKNYYNDYYWEKKLLNQESDFNPNTIKNDQIYEAINLLEDLETAL